MHNIHGYPAGKLARYPAGYPAEYPAGYPAKYLARYPARYPAGYPARSLAGYPARYPAGHLAASGRISGRMEEPGWSEASIPRLRISARFPAQKKIDKKSMDFQFFL